MGAVTQRRRPTLPAAAQLLVRDAEQGLTVQIRGRFGWPITEYRLAGKQQLEGLLGAAPVQQIGVPCGSPKGHQLARNVALVVGIGCMAVLLYESADGRVFVSNWLLGLGAIAGILMVEAIDSPLIAVLSPAGLHLEDWKGVRRIARSTIEEVRQVDGDLNLSLSGGKTVVLYAPEAARVLQDLLQR